MQATPMPPGQGSDPSQGPPSGPPQAGGQQAGGAEQAIQMIQKGFESLSKMIQAAGQNLDPEDIKLFQMAVKATDDFIQAVTSPEEQQEEAPQKPQASGPMPANANAGAKPAPQY